MKTTGSRASAVSQTRGFGDLLYDKAGARPSLDLDFAGTSSLRDKITGEYLVDHTRATIGTYTDSEGLIKNAVINYQIKSQDFSSTPWATTGLSVASTTESAPDGSPTATKYTPTNGSAYKRIQQNGSQTVPGAGAYTISFHVKTQGYRYVHVRTGDSPSKEGRGFDLETETFFDGVYEGGQTYTQRSGTIQNLGDGWYRIAVHLQNFGSPTYILPYFSKSTTSVDGQDGASGDYIMTWGWQIEHGDTLNDYVKTGSTVNSAPRFTHELVETGNLLTDTYRLLNDWAVTNGTLEPYAALAPDGTYSAQRLTIASGGSGYVQPNAFKLTSGKTYTASVYVKSTGTSSHFNLWAYAGGYLGQSGQTAAPTEWTRYEINFTATAANTQVGLNNAPSNYASDVLFWGFQLEEADSASTYVPSIDTFTSRQSNATYVDSAGLVKTAYRNHLKYSEQFDNSYWVKQQNLSVTANVAIAPDGTQTADKLVPSTANTDYHFLFATQSLVGALSIYAKADGYNYISLIKQNSFNNSLGVSVNLTDGSIQAISSDVEAEVINAGNGWYRIILKQTSNASSNFIVLQPHNGATPNQNNKFRVTYTGDGTSGVLLWGAMHTNNPLDAGDYVKTEATATGAARYSHDPETLTPTGLYLEPAATNIATYSNGFNNWSVSGATRNLANTETLSPDGTYNAWKWSVHGGLSYPSVFTTYSTTNSTPHTFSVFAKAGTLDKLGLEIRGTGVTPQAFFNLTNGTVQSGTGQIKKYPNGWYRCSVTITTDTSELFIIRGGDGSNQPGSIYIFGAQVETGTFATSYIPTENVTVTRAADVYTSTANLTETIEPRGLLIERDVSNKAGKTESFDAGYTYHNCTFPVDNSVTNPDGSTGAIALTINAGNRSRGNYIGFNRGDNAYTTQVVSLFVKKKTTRYVLVGQGGATYYQQALFDFDTESIVTDPSISQTNGNGLTLVNRGVVKYPNGWFRIFLETYGATASNGAGVSVVKYAATSKIDASGTITYDGTEAVYIWGFNITDRPYLSSYIPNTTGTSQVTRSADVASISGDNFGTYRTNQLSSSKPISYNASNQSSTKHTNQPIIDSRASFEPYAALAPDGTFSAGKLTFNEAQTTGDGAMQYSINNPQNSADGTFSFYARTISGTATIRIKMGVNTTTASGGDFTVTDQWQRFERYRANGGSNFGICNPLNSQIGTSILIWGFQREEGITESTNFIPSTDTFTSRLGNATYVDSNGLIKTAYKNNFVYSNNFTSWSNSNNRHTFAGTVTAPDGTQTASKFIMANLTDNNAVLYQTAAANGAVSVYAKADGMTHINLLLQNNGLPNDSPGAQFDLINGTVTFTANGTGEMIDEGNGWWRCILKPDAFSSSIVAIQPNTGTQPSTTFFFRSTVSGDGIKGIHLWHAMQTNDKDDAGEYAPTEGTRTGGPRYSHDPETLVPTGLYLEDAATNVLPNHNLVNQLIGVTQSGNAATAPDGTQTATRIAEQAVSNRHIAYQAALSSIPADSTVSVFIKGETVRYVGFILHVGGGNTTPFIIDTQEGVVTQTIAGFPNYKLTKYPNGWYRFSYYHTGANNGNLVLSACQTPTTSGIPVTAGSPTYLGSTSNTYLYWGLQAETGKVVSSPILSSGTALTRATDAYTSTATSVFDRDGGNKEAFWSPTANTMFGQMIYNQETEYPRLYELNSPNGEAMTIFMEHGSNKVNGRLTTGAGLQYTDTVGNATHNTSVKLATTYQLNDAITAIDGSVGAQDNTVALHVLPSDSKRPTSATIGDRLSTNRHANAPIQRITHWKTRLPDASLINITQQ